MHAENLRNERTFDANVYVTISEPADLLSIKDLENVNEIFRDNLSEKGIIDDRESYNLLDCDLKILALDNNIVIDIKVGFYKFNPDEKVFPLVFEVSDLPLHIFSEKIENLELASLCSSRFIEYWEEYNPSLPPSRRL